MQMLPRFQFHPGNRLEISISSNLEKISTSTTVTNSPSLSCNAQMAGRRRMAMRSWNGRLETSRPMEGFYLSLRLQRVVRREGPWSGGSMRFRPKVFWKISTW